MGIGDFLSDVGDAIVPESVENVAGGLVHGASTVGRGAAWAANPSHWDDIAMGVQDVGAFIANNPGQTWDVGFEVGRHIVKEEILDPKNLAINLGLTAATVFTGGGAGAALGARIGAGALKTAKAVDSAVTGARITRTAARAGKTLRSVDEAMGATKAFNRGVDVLGYVPGKIRQGREALGMSSYGIRGSMANKIASESAMEAGEVGLMRGAVSDVVRGAATRPGAVAGSTSSSQAFADINYAANRAQMYQSVPGATKSASRFGEQIYQAEQDPYGYAMRHGGRELLQKAGSMFGARAAKNMFKEEEEETPTAAVSAAYTPPPDTPDIPSTGYGYRRGGMVTPDVSESEYTSSAVAPIAVGRGASFYQGASTDSYKVTRYG